MSRYFTSPPPVYARNWANGQNLVESTKIESQQIVSSKKLHRKEKKKEKKLKKVKNYPTKQQVSDESEQLEKSCLTEEQVHSVGYLSDGSQNSKKRIREASPAVESHIKATHVAGNPLRIRFVFKKPKEAEALPPQEDRVCSTSVHEIVIPSELKKRKKHKSSKETWYKSLFDEWVPPCISFEEDNGNSDDWLFGTRREDNAVIKKDEDVIMQLKTSEDSSFPRARYLSEAGIFSLPYTVPF